jgi:CubicO group peptidase (beta-lactamase class C family)
MRVIPFGSWILACLSLAGAALAAESIIPDTEGGRRIAAYVEASNSDDPARMAAFFKDNFAPPALVERSVDERIARWKKNREMLGRLTPVRLVDSREDRIALEIRGENGDVPTFTFDFEPGPPHRILGVKAMLGGPPEPSSLPEIPPAGLDAWLQGMTDQDMFSGVVLVHKGGQEIFEKACGMADRSAGVPNRLDTKFNLGSINKEMTRIAIAILGEQGKIRPDDKIGAFLPDYPNREAASKVTVAQLVAHRGGIGDFFNDRYETTPHSQIRTIADYLKLFADKPLEFVPGTQSKYSNGGYVVLGAIIEKVSGRPYEDFIREALLGPAGMSGASWISVDEIASGRATGYTRHADAGGPPEGELRANTYTLPGRGSPAGGGYATAADLVKLAAALQNGVLLTRPWTSWVLDSPAAPWPAPATKEIPRGRLTEGGLGIAGGAPGVSAAMEWELDDDLIVVVLANLDPPLATNVASKIKGWVAAHP